MKAELKAWHERARACGILTEFVDNAGVRRSPAVETLRALVPLLEVETKREAVPPVIVCWDGKPKRVVIAADSAPAEVTLVSTEPGGTARAASGMKNRLAARGALPGRARIRLPSLPFGYYELRVRWREHESSCLVISAPTRAYEVPRVRAWGVFAPMYGARSKESWGAGTFSDWRRLCASLDDAPCAALLVPRTSKAVATLPLLGAFLDEWKCDASPYSPVTRLFWNEFYLDVTRAPELAASRAAQRLVNTTKFQNQIAALRADELVDYRAEMSLKRQVLEVLAAEFFCHDSPRRTAFEAFRKSRTELERYAAFRAACERQQKSWSAWPARLRRGGLRPSDYDAGAKRYHLFVQWLAQEQMEAVLATCRAHDVKFCLDLPLGVDADGFDVWANQELFVCGASVGAPPDAFFTKGQNWGFPPLHPWHVRASGYRYVIDFLRFQMRHTELLRLDHVMALHRLWWIPRGASAAEGAYVRYPPEELYAILCLESHRHRTMLVGENLGTVPPEVNESMRRHGLRTTYVVQYEAQPRARALRPPPRECVASLNTHDMPMWAAFWRGLDIPDRQQLGLLTPAQVREERKRRAALRSALEKFLRRKKILTGKATPRFVLHALLKFLARSRAEVVLVNLEDLWLETRPQNTPGTSTERVNWRRKMKRTLKMALPALVEASRRDNRE